MSGSNNEAEFSNRKVVGRGELENSIASDLILLNVPSISKMITVIIVILFNNTLFIYNYYLFYYKLIRVL